MLECVAEKPGQTPPTVGPQGLPRIMGFFRQFPLAPTPRANRHTLQEAPRIIHPDDLIAASQMADDVGISV